MIMSMLIMGLTLFVGEPETLGDGQSSLIRWSDASAMVGAVVKIDEQGVYISTEESPVAVCVPLYDVRKLEGQSTLDVKMRATAQAAWRAHARRVKGDMVGARQIYAELESAYLWRVGPQSADVSLGLLACRLDQGDRVQAIVPFLSWLRATNFAPGAEPDTVEGRGGGFDESFGLYIDLPPVFGPVDHAVDLGVMNNEMRDGDRQSVLFGYYKLAIQGDIHQTLEAQEILKQLRAQTRKLGSRDKGLLLVEHMVLAQAHPDSSKRQSARDELGRQARVNKGTWIELWARLGIGSAMIGEQGDSSQSKIRDRGLIELIHIAVRLGHLSRPVAELSAEIANTYLVQTGRERWGEELVSETRDANLSSGMFLKEQQAHD